MAADFRDETDLRISFHLSVPDQGHYTDYLTGHGFSVDIKELHQLILPPISYVSHEDRLPYRPKLIFRSVSTLYRLNLPILAVYTEGLALRRRLSALYNLLMRFISFPAEGKLYKKSRESYIS